MMNSDIKAYETFIGSIWFNLKKCGNMERKKIKDWKEIEYKLRNVGMNHIYFNDNRVLDIIGLEFSFKNGLIWFESIIKYIDKNSGNIRTLHQSILTLDYEGIPLITLNVEKERKSINQLLCSNMSKDIIYLDDERNIEIRSVGIQAGNCIKNSCFSYFESYLDLNTDHLLLQKYRQYYNNLNDDNSLSLNKMGNIQIGYRKNKPAFVTFHDNIESDTVWNSSLKAREVVNEINREVIKISEIIREIIEKQQNVYYDGIKKKERQI